MARNIEVRTDARTIREYASALSTVHRKLVNDAEQLACDFFKAQWNDAVAEKARQTLNSYISELNSALGHLGCAVRGAEELSDIAEQYEAME